MKQESLDRVVETTRKSLRDGELLPMFFIGNDQSFSIVAANFGDDEDKDATAAAVRRMAKEFEATFVLMVSEIWTIPPEHAEDFMNNRKKYGQVSNHPKSFEAVAFQLETPEGHRTGLARIEAGREMGPIHWMDLPVGAVSGRFAHFLGPKAVKS